MGCLDPAPRLIEGRLMSGVTTILESAEAIICEADENFSSAVCLMAFSRSPYSFFWSLGTKLILEKKAFKTRWRACV